MRTIKFRGKRLDTETWIYGDLIQWKSKGIAAILPYVLEVDPSTVGQYTGLKDKNGKEIFEGDIIQVNTIVNKAIGLFEDEFIEQELIAEVVWRDEHACFDLETLEDDDHLKSWGFYEDCNDLLTITGNIHENQTD